MGGAGWVEGGEPRKAGARIVAGGRGCSNVFRMQGYTMSPPVWIADDEMQDE